MSRAAKPRLVRMNLVEKQKSGGEFRDLGQLQAEATPPTPARAFMWKRLLLAADALGWSEKKLDQWRPYFFGANGDAGYSLPHLERVVRGFETRAVSKLMGRGAGRRKATW